MNTITKFLIIISLIYSVLFATLIFFIIHRYYNAKKKCGLKLTTIKRPLDVILRKIATFVILFIAMNMRITDDFFLLLPVIYSFIALFLLAWFDLQPQEIYENGILISTGLIKWSDIQCVESLEMKDHIIKITLINYRFGTKTINLHCFPGLASNFVELISTNANNNK